MAPWVKIRKIMLRYFTGSRWYILLGITVFYGALAYVLLDYADESELTSQTNFIYWLIVTASTVGYGDLSPQSEAGKWVVSLYVIPVGLSLFAYVIGHFAASVSDQWKKGVKGLKPVHITDHILVIGWNGQRTLQLLSLLIRERDTSAEQPEIVLCVKADIENPLPGKIEFVHVESFNADSDMDRASVAFASTILIDNPEDDVTMTTALYCAQRNPNAHQVAYFNDDSLVGLLQTHCPKVECTPSVAVEMLAKSAFDPGSSMLHHDLLNVEDGQAQYSITLPDEVETLSFETAFINIKRKYNAILISVAPDGKYQDMLVNPDFDQTIKGGDKVFYIADERIHRIDWNSVAQSS
jgi:voltage-gated potassium channel